MTNQKENKTPALFSMIFESAFRGVFVGATVSIVRNLNHLERVLTDVGFGVGTFLSTLTFLSMAREPSSAKEAFAETTALGILTFGALALCGTGLDFSAGGAAAVFLIDSTVKMIKLAKSQHKNL
jgi:hypothetical protein